MGPREVFSKLFYRQAKRDTTIFLPKHRVASPSPDYGVPIRPRTAYCRMRLVEMRLSTDQEFFVERYPMVHAAISFVHGTERREIPALAGPGRIKNLTKTNLNRVITYNEPLTPLFPFNRDDVQIEAGLFSVPNNEAIKRFISAMEQVSGLLAVPELVPVLKLIGPAYDGIESVLGLNESRLEIGYRDTFTAAANSDNKLRSGYFAVIQSAQKPVEAEKLCIVNNSLHTGALGTNGEFLRDHQLLDGYSYMLFRIEQEPTQDWGSFESIKSLVRRLQDAVLKKQPSDDLWASIKLTVYQSDDLLDDTDYKDKMLAKIKAETRRLLLQSADSVSGRRSLQEILQGPDPEIDAEIRVELAALKQLFAA